MDSNSEISAAAIFQKSAFGVGLKSILHPRQMLLLVLAGWINGHEQNAIEYWIAGNRILREKLGKKRILLNDEQAQQGCSPQPDPMLLWPCHSALGNANS